MASFMVKGNQVDETRFTTCRLLGDLPTCTAAQEDSLSCINKDYQGMDLVNFNDFQTRMYSHTFWSDALGLLLNVRINSLTHMLCLEYHGLFFTNAGTVTLQHRMTKPSKYPTKCIYRIKWKYNSTILKKWPNFTVYL